MEKRYFDPPEKFCTTEKFAPQEKFLTPMLETIIFDASANVNSVHLRKRS